MMTGRLKTFALNLVAGANVLTVALMLLAGYSDRIQPELHPWISCAGMVFPFFLVANLAFTLFWVVFSWKRLLISLAGFALAYVPIRIYMPLHFAQEPPPDDALCVLSYNVAGYAGNYKYEEAFDTILAYIVKQQPDIVCLQEDMTSKWKNTQRDFARHFKYNDTTQINMPEYSNLNCLGLHTRFPILKKERICYESRANGSVAYYLKTGNDTLLLINNHLESTHLSSDDRLRYRQMIDGDMQRDTAKSESRMLIDKLAGAMAIRARHVAAIKQYIGEHSQYPVIVSGDFNDTPISYTRHAMAQGLTDCFVEAGCGLGLSFNQRGFNFRIDHMMCSAHFTPCQCKVDKSIDASDHYPLLCWFRKADQ